jgi:hypothetical protein
MQFASGDERLDRAAVIVALVSRPALCGRQRNRPVAAQQEGSDDDR